MAFTYKEMSANRSPMDPELDTPPFDSNFGFSVGGALKKVTGGIGGGLFDAAKSFATSGIKVAGSVIKQGVNVTLAPVLFVEGTVKGVVPSNLRKYIITPAQYQSNLVNKPKETIHKTLSVAKQVTYRPTYELTKKAFGPETAGMLMPEWVNPEDVGIKPGTEAAMKFRIAQSKGTAVAGAVASVAAPAAGLAIGAYQAAKTIKAQKEAKELMEKYQKAQEAAMMAQAQQDMAEYDKALAEMKALEAQIEAMSKKNPDMESPTARKKKMAVIAGTGAVAIAAMTMLD